ncbi:BTAD domain-containing putative transcriptional regulator [Streptomyces sp. NPDC059175]|uniref:AfsR/SARP family transcriptional regulator n=1 Tax=unclassified Streptomyces TaxID=2593676 RepID=UPI0036ACF8D3
MRFGLLGPLTVHDAADEIRTVGSAKLRTLLGTLLLRANRVVPVEELKYALWSGEPPASAQASLHNHVTRLRRLLAEPDRLRAVAPGYLLRVEPGELDVDLFEQHVAAVRAAHARATRVDERSPHQPGEAVRRDLETVVVGSRAALDLWRGDPLTGLYDPEDGVPAAAQRLRESWLMLLEWRYDAFLGLGRPDGLGPELAALTAQFPLREVFFRQLMLVLHRTGRQPEALAAYQSLRRTLAEELGIDPGPAVQEAYQEVLQGPAPAARGGPRHSSSPRPAQLPSAPAHFIGRTRLVKELRAVLIGPTRPAVAVLSGMAGVGKSALALHVAHSLRDAFPDGQLHLNLHGATPGVSPLDPRRSLPALLGDLGVPPRAVPEDPDAAAALLRSTLAPTRTLLVLDDAASAAQVRPLLPAGPGCAVVVTSRSPLTALDGAARFALAPLSARDSTALLRAVSGRGRSLDDDADPAELDETAAMERLVELCGRLPLALRIVAARLAARRALTPSALAGLLTAEADRLDHLEYDDLSVRRSLSVAHDALDPDAALALRRLGAVDLPVYDAVLVAQLMGSATDERRAVAAVERLVDVALLDEVAYRRFAPHDLVRDFARELSARLDGEEERAAAAERALRWYGEKARQVGLALVPAHLAGTRVPPQIGEAVPFAGEAEALAWGDRELPNIVALVQAFAPRSVTALRVVRAAFTYLQRRGRLQELSVLNEIALEAARGSGDPQAEAHALTDLAGVNFMLGRSERSLALNDEGIALWRQVGEDSWVQRGLSNRGLLLERLERYAEAARALEESLVIARRLGDDYAEGIIFSHLGNLHEHTDARLALSYHERSLAVGMRLGSMLLRESAHCNMGYARLTLGEPAQAQCHFEACLNIVGTGDDGDWQSQSQARLGLVRALREQGLHAAAVRECRLVLERAAPRGDLFTEGLARHELGLLLRAEGRGGEALVQWRRAHAALEGTDAKVLPELREFLDEQDGGQAV